MPEVRLSSTETRPVRIYATDYADSDNESEREAQSEVDSENEEQYSISTRLQQNQQYMDNQITPPSGQRSNWVLEPQSWTTSDGIKVVLVRKPTASNLSHRLLNPFTYRNIQNVGTLDALATLLETPANWEESYNQIVQNR